MSQPGRLDDPRSTDRTLIESVIGGLYAAVIGAAGLAIWRWGSTLGRGWTVVLSVLIGFTAGIAMLRADGMKRVIAVVGLAALVVVLVANLPDEDGEGTVAAGKTTSTTGSTAPSRQPTTTTSTSTTTPTTVPTTTTTMVSPSTAQLTSWTEVTSLNSGEFLDLVHRLGSQSSRPTSRRPRPPLPLPGGYEVIVPDALVRFTETQAFRRLANVRQLSFLSFLLPGATHTRLAHAYDTLRVAIQLSQALSEDPEFRLMVGSVDQTHLLLLALLHDVNHVPFLHVIQESDVSRIRNVPVLDVIADGEATGDDPGLYGLLSDIGMPEALFKEIILGTWEEQASPVSRLFSSILKSGVDVDKLSYLPLDSLMTGLGTARTLDVARLVAGARVVQREEHWHLAYHEDAQPAVEAAIGARFWGFDQLYWRPDNRGMMRSFLARIDALFGDDDAGFQDFLTQHIREGDRELLASIDAAYRARFHRGSGLLDLVQSPESAPVPIYRGEDLYDIVSSYDRAQRGEMEHRLRTLVAETLGVAEEHVEVLIDRPRRVLKLGGDAYIVRRTGAIESVAQASGYVRDLDRRYQRLARTVTVYVDAATARALEESRKFEGTAAAIRGTLRGQPAQVQ